MVFEEKWITLKDGTQGVLRSPYPGEGALYLDFLKNICVESEFVANYPEEINFTLSDEEKWISSGLENPLLIHLSCFIDGKLAANCGVHKLTKIKFQHRAIVDIAVRKEFWNRGLGTILLQELIAIAKGWGVEQIELEVVGDNARARHVYEKVGFRAVAEVPRAIRTKDGVYHSLVTMIYQGD